MRKRNKYIALILSILFVAFSFCVIGCSHKSTKPPTSHKTQMYYPEKWETENFPEYHAEIVQFHHEDKCDTCIFLQKSILELLDTTFSPEADEGIIIYRSITTNYAENTPIKQVFSVMEEDLCSSIYIEGKHHQIEIWRDIFMAVEEDPVFAKEQLESRMEKLVQEVRKMEKKENI
jgi:hypothetical protein